MNARRGCDQCDRITVWAPENSVKFGIKCTRCGAIESGDGFQWAMVARGCAGQFPHESGCSRPEPRVRASTVVGGTRQAECPDCHAETWVAQ
jgi:hypothetical protein